MFFCLDQRLMPPKSSMVSVISNMTEQVFRAIVITQIQPEDLLWRHILKKVTGVQRRSSNIHDIVRKLYRAFMVPYPAIMELVSLIKCCVWSYFNLRCARSFSRGLTRESNLTFILTHYYKWPPFNVQTKTRLLQLIFNKISPPQLFLPLVMPPIQAQISLFFKKKMIF